MDQIQLYISLTLLSFFFASLGAYFKQRFLYFVAFAFAIILFSAPVFLSGLPPSSNQYLNYLVARFNDGFFFWYSWPLILLYIVWVLYVLRGSTFGWYEEVIEPRKSVWITFGAIVLLTVLAVTSGFFNVRARILGLESMSQHLANTLEDTKIQAETLNINTSKLRTKEGMDEEAATTLERALVEQNAKYVDWQATIVISMTNAFSATLTLPIEQNNRTSEVFQQNHNLQTVRTILPLAKAIQIRARTIYSATSPLLVEDIIFQAEEIDVLASALLRTVPVFDIWDPVPVLLVLSVFVLFLLMPWLLYLSFIFSKRSTTVRDRRMTLRDMEIERRFVNSSTSLILDEGGIAKEVANHLLEAEKILVGKEDISEMQRKSAKKELKKALNELRKRSNCKLTAEDDRRNKTLVSSVDLVSLKRYIKVAKDSADLHDVQTATNLAIDILVKQRRFHSREYIVPLLILTLLTLFGWYYIILPNTVRGLIDFVDRGSSVAALTDMFTDHFTPVTMAFTGAWLFIIIMLTHRWVTNDLYPKSYFYSAVRLVTAFVVGLVFTAISRSLPTDADWLISLILPLAFAVGAAPIEWVRAMWRALGRVGSSIKESRLVNRGLNSFGSAVVQEFRPPDWGSKHNLTELDDISIWDDTRFHQEGISNVHAMATADLDRLIISTPYDAQTLIDWVDQALLFIHAKDLWRPGLAVIGIRNATDFLNYAWNEDRHCTNKSQVTSVTKAYNHALVANVGPGDPRYEASTSAVKLESGAKDLSRKIETIRNTADNLDKIKWLRMELNEVSATIVLVQKTWAQVYKTLSKIQSGGSKLDDAKKAWQTTKGIQKVKDAIAAIQKTAEEDKLSRAKLLAKDKDALTALSKIQVEIDSQVEQVKAVADEADSAKEKFDKAQAEFFGAGGQNDTNRTLFETAATQIKETLINITKLRTAVDNVNMIAKALKYDDPKSWDQVGKLQEQLQENGLKKAVDDIADLRVSALVRVNALGKTYSAARAGNTLEALEKTQAKASQSTEAAVNEISKGSVPDDLVEIKNKTITAIKDAKTLASGAKTAAEEVMQASYHTVITSDIVKIILASMDRDPNIMYVRNFWRNRRKSETSN